MAGCDLLDEAGAGTRHADDKHRLCGGVAKPRGGGEEAGRATLDQSVHLAGESVGVKAFAGIGEELAAQGVGFEKMGKRRFRPIGVVVKDGDGKAGGDPVEKWALAVGGQPREMVEFGIAGGLLAVEGQHLVGFGKIGVDCQRLPEAGRGFVEPAERDQCVTEAVPGSGEPRVERESVAKGRLGRFRLLRPEQGQPEHVMRLGILGRPRDGLPVKGQRLVEPAEFGERHAERAIGLDPLRSQSERAAQRRLDLGKAALAEKRLRAVDVSFGEIGRQLYRAIGARQGRFQLALLGLQGGEIAPGTGIIRL
jgi:hypothetical protein